MKRHDGWKRFLSGSIAGLAGSVLVKGMQVAGMKYAPKQMPPLRQDPGEYMIQKAENVVAGAGDHLTEVVEEIPRSVEKATAQALGVGYGVTFALLFALSRPKVSHLVLEGSALGVATWAAGYLGWLPATGLMKPVTRQKPVQVIGAIASHVAFGLATAALYRELRKRI